MVIYKKYFYVFLFLVTLSLCGIIGFNYYIDSANQFSRTEAFSTKVTRMLLDKKEVMVRTNFNERLLQKKMLSKIPHRPDVLVLGSSHSLAITQDLFAPLSFYNASVSNAELEDDMALYYVYQKRNWQPKVVVICVDPWILDPDFAAVFNGKKATQQWKSSLLFEYINAKKLILGTNDLTYYDEQVSGSFDKYSQLLSVDLLESSASTLLFDSVIHSIAPNYYDDCRSCNILRPDGSRILSKQQESTTLAEADLSVAKLIQNLQLSTQTYKKYSSVDPIYKDTFEKFIHYLKSKNVIIIFYLPPLEPLAYSHIIEENPNYQSTKEMEKYFISVASRYHLKVIGSYNPAKAGLTGNDFVDGSHLKAEGIYKVFLGHPFL